MFLHYPETINLVVFMSASLYNLIIYVYLYHGQYNVFIISHRVSYLYMWEGQ